MDPKQTHTIENGRKYVIVEERVLEEVLRVVRELRELLAAGCSGGGEGG